MALRLFVLAALGLSLGSAGFAVWKVGEMRAEVRK